MAFLSTLKEKRNISPNAPWFEFVTGWPGWKTAANEEVTSAKALTVSAFFQGIRILSETVATLPFHLYQRLPNGGKRRALDHPLYPILKEQPNPEQKAYQFRELIQGHCLLRGVGYGQKVFRQGRVAEIWPLHPDRIKEMRTPSGKRAWEYQIPGKKRVILMDEQVFRVCGPFSLGILELARETLGTSIAQERYAGRFFANGTVLSGLVKSPKKLSDTAFERVKKRFRMEHQGSENAHGVLFLEEGLEYDNVGMTNEDSQFLESRQFSVEEVARWLNLPPHILRDLRRATFSNIEEQELELVVYSLLPWFRRWESECSSLIPPEERSEYFCEFLVDGLLRGDIEKRTASYVAGRQWGWYSPNDILAMENKNPISPDDGGDSYLQPLNMVPAGSQPEEIQTEDEEGRKWVIRTTPQRQLTNGDEALMLRDTAERRQSRSISERLRLRNSYKGLFLDAAGRMVNAEANDVERLVKKHSRSVKSLETELEKMYGRFEGQLERTFWPVISSYAGSVSPAAAAEIGADPLKLEEFSRAYTQALAKRWVGSSKGQLVSIIGAAAAGAIFDALLERVQEWRDRRPEKVASRETVQAESAFTKETYKQSGVPELIWRKTGADTCEFCSWLDGKRVRIDAVFVEAGSEIDPGNGAEPMKVYRAVGHSPLHAGCDCIMVAAV